MLRPGPVVHTGHGPWTDLSPGRIALPAASSIQRPDGGTEKKTPLLWAPSPPWMPAYFLLKNEASNFIYGDYVSFHFMIEWRSHSELFSVADQSSLFSAWDACILWWLLYHIYIISILLNREIISFPMNMIPTPVCFFIERNWKQANKNFSSGLSS